VAFFAVSEAAAEELAPGWSSYGAIRMTEKTLTRKHREQPKPPGAPESLRSAPKVWAFIELARPHHYLKNGFVFLPLFFGYKLGDLGALSQTVLAFVAFCLAASAVYAVNDLADAEEDRAHPVKKSRPVARGAIAPQEAVFFASALAAAALAVSYMAGSALVLLLVAAYLAVNLAYSLALKHVAVLDVVVVGLGFVLRVEAGGSAAAVQVSHWLVIMTFLLALFLALAKRRDDLLLARAGASARRCIDGYSLEFVSMSMGLMAAVAVVSYIMYTLSPDVMATHGTDRLYLTAFWVIVGVLRYMQVAIVEESSGSPTRVLIRDRFLQLVLAGWIATFFVLLYLPGLT
jgi:decaprenyl-phosphate phosphoribosyltransferase